jgi:hypothetical protein
MNDQSNSPPLVTADESTVGKIVAPGLLRLPAGSVEEAISRVRNLKSTVAVAQETRIHCRVMFTLHSRKNIQFSHFNVEDRHELLLACVSAMNQLSGTWWGAHVDRGMYPRSLRFIEGQAFRSDSSQLS